MSTETSRRRKRAVSGDEREQAILDTAERLLAERPLHDISIDDLARGAGISRPTFYFYFASKDAVLLTLVARGAAMLRATTEPLYERLEDDPAAACEELLQAVWDLWAERHRLQIAVVDACVTSDEVRGVWERVMADLIDQATAAIERAREHGALPRSDVAARDIVTALSWMTERMMYTVWSGRTPTIERDRVVSTLAHIWLSSLTRAG